jgi:hypothetical protein
MKFIRSSGLLILGAIAIVVLYFVVKRKTVTTNVEKPASTAVSAVKASPAISKATAGVKEVSSTAASVASDVAKILSVGKIFYDDFAGGSSSVKVGTDAVPYVTGHEQYY